MYYAIKYFLRRLVIVYNIYCDDDKMFMARIPRMECGMYFLVQHWHSVQFEKKNIKKI